MWNRPKRRHHDPLSGKPRYNQGLKEKIKDGTDMLKSSTFLCNRDRQYLKKIHNAGGKVELNQVPVTTTDKLVTLGLVKQVIRFTKSDVALVRKIIKVGEVDGKDLRGLKNAIFKNLQKKTWLEITKEGQNALVVSIVAGIKTL